MLNSYYKNYKAEAWDILQYLFKAKRINDHTLHFIAKFSGKLDLELLSKAIDISINVFHLIRCRYNESKRRPYWEEAGYTASDIIEFVEIQNGNQEYIKQYLYQQIEAFNGPQLNIKLIRVEDKDTLCILMSHMLCDAAGFKEYLYVLSSIYSNIENNQDYQAIPRKNRKVKQILKNLSITEKVKIMFSKANIFTYDDVKFELEGDLSNPFIEIRTINKEDFSRLKVYDKEHEATINDIMLTAYIRVLFELFGRCVTIPCTVDLRKYLPNHRGEGFCNLCTNLICNIGDETGRTFEETLYKVKKEMNKQKSNIACIKSVAMLEKVFDILPYKIARGIVEKKFVNPPIAFTNIGIIDEKQLAFGDSDIIEAYMTGSIKYDPYFQLAVSTFDNVATLSVNLYGTQLDKNKVNIFLDKFINELQASVY